MEKGVYTAHMNGQSHAGVLSFECLYCKNALLCSCDVIVLIYLTNYETCRLRMQTMHLHKTLGILCLLSFIWRMTQINDSDMGFQTKPYLTIPTLCLHLTLSLSSLEFKIPFRRIKEGSRIWPEYRLHSIVFASRSIAAMALYWFEQTYNKEPIYVASVLIALSSMAAADLSTMSQKHQSKSIRDLDVSRATGYFFSACQFYATAGVRFGVRRYTIQFLCVFMVQLNPFLMTLRRKNLISHYAAVTIYGFILVFGFIVCFFEYKRFGVSMLRTVAFVANIAIVWRTSPLPIKSNAIRNIVQNKYLLWTVLGVLTQYIRPLAVQEMSMRRQVVYTIALAAVVANGVIKCRSGNYSHGTDDKKPIKKVA